MRTFEWDEFHNEVEAVRRFPDFVVGLTRRSAKTTVPPHRHAGVSFVCLVGGRHHWHGTDGKIHWSSPGTWYLRPLHHIHSHEACQTDVLGIGFNIPSDVFPNVASWTEDMTLGGDVGLQMAEGMYSELLHPTPGGDLLLRGYLYQLLGEFTNLRHSPSGNNLPEIVVAATELIRGRFFEPLSLEYVADELSVHRSHLARLFRRHLGLTLGEYLRDRRLEWSFQRLKHGNHKIANIAVEAGFADHAHFCRLFKARYGLTPGEHRVGKSATHDDQIAVE